MHGVYACEIVYHIFLRHSMLDKRIESQAKGMCARNLCFMCSHNKILMAQFWCDLIYIYGNKIHLIFLHWP